MTCSTNRVQAIAATMAPIVFLVSAPRATPIIPKQAEEITVPRPSCSRTRRGFSTLTRGRQAIVTRVPLAERLPQSASKPPVYPPVPVYPGKVTDPAEPVPWQVTGTRSLSRVRGDQPEIWRLPGVVAVPGWHMCLPGLTR
jgi:hypothetical protein